jgi:hypothetical protein
MRASRSPSDWLRGLSPREQRFVRVGAGASAAALALTLVLLPAAERWAAREEAYAASRDRWTRLQALVASERELRRALDEQRRARRGTVELLLTGPTPALAATNLQVLLQQYAEESFVQLNRVDVAGQPRAEGPGLLAIPVVLQGQGDIYALVDFLYRVQHGPRLLVIDEISVNNRSSSFSSSSSGREQQALVWSLRARGLYPAAEGPAAEGAAGSPARSNAAAAAPALGNGP